MLAEKFFLLLETLKSHPDPDGSTRVGRSSARIATFSSGRGVSCPLSHPCPLC